MNIKEHLNRGRTLDKQIKAKMEQIQLLRDLQMDVSVKMSHTNSARSGKRDKMGDITAKVLDLITELERDIIRLLEVKADIRAVVASVKNEQHRILLSLRYENYMTWEQVACEMDCSWQNIHKMHSRALKGLLVCDSIL